MLNYQRVTFRQKVLLVGFFFRDFPTRSHIKSILRVESQNNEMNKEVVGGFKHDFYVPFHIWDVIICH